jgi:ADP-ribosylglycohydrolase
MVLPHDYAERVYAGVLGKIIGVYLGRPFEGWSKERIEQELGEIRYYVNEKRGVPLILIDDDITGTFTFLRALPDHGNNLALTPEQIGHTWLNYIIENQSILWWGGMGNSTEHTAFLRLKAGISAPRSGSCELNSKVVSEQIGAQIFIDGWAMVAPNDPALAVDLARRAASVSHDGEAIYGAQVIAAMESAAFGESDLNRLLDIAVSFIPADSIIYRMIAELRQLRTTEPDWRNAFAWLREHYGYERYGGGCHMIPNHGLIILSLLWGDDDFQKTMMIVNTCGWDTDCNAANVGCLLGIKNGLAAFEGGPDWRGPVADRLYLPTVDGGRAISDAVQESGRIINSGRALQGLLPDQPKNGARFHFSYPGAVQGFTSANGEAANAPHPHQAEQHCLRLQGAGLRTTTPTFFPPEMASMSGGYGFTSSPSLYPGQTLHASLIAAETNQAVLRCCLLVENFAPDGITLQQHRSAVMELQPGEAKDIHWHLAEEAFHPITTVGIDLIDNHADDVLFVDWLTWDGTPQLELLRFADDIPFDVLMRPWVKVTDWRMEYFGSHQAYRMLQNRGRGLLLQGAREWHNYSASATLKAHFAESFGLAAYVQGYNRYYALLLERGGKARLVKSLDTESVLAEVDFDWHFDQTYLFALAINDGIIQAAIDGSILFELSDPDPLLDGGAVGILLTEGNLYLQSVKVGS